MTASVAARVGRGMAFLDGDLGRIDPATVDVAHPTLCPLSQARHDYWPFYLLYGLDWATEHGFEPVEGPSYWQDALDLNAEWARQLRAQDVAKGGLATVRGSAAGNPSLGAACAGSSAVGRSTLVGAPA